MVSAFYDNYALNKGALYSKDNILTNKYLLGSKTTNVLKKDYTLDHTNYEKLKINEQYNKLYSNTFTKNKDNIILSENNKVYNLSFSILISNAIKVYMEIINELSIFFSKEQPDKSINKLIYIFVKGDNLIYVGLLITILSFLFWLIDVTK